MSKIIKAIKDKASREKKDIGIAQVGMSNSKTNRHSNKQKLLLAREGTKNKLEATMELNRRKRAQNTDSNN
jgi:hypothetical protein